jgi:hypothetical protein
LILAAVPADTADNEKPDRGNVVARMAARRKGAVKPAKGAGPRSVPNPVFGENNTAKSVQRGSSRSAPARKPAARRPQRFTVSHLREEDFKREGLRSCLLYRELGMAAAGGLCQAHLIRLVAPCTHEARERHYREPELQLVYVLKGWMKNEFEGHGAQLMLAGSCWLQPPGIRRTVPGYSGDCEVLEIVVPADFKIVELPESPG